MASSVLPLHTAQVARLGQFLPEMAQVLASESPRKPALIRSYLGVVLK